MRKRKRKRGRMQPIQHPVPIWAVDAYMLYNNGCIPPEDGWYPWSDKPNKWRFTISRP